MPSDADITHARRVTIEALRERGVSSRNAEKIGDALARNAEREREGLPTTSRSIPTHLLKTRP